MVVLLLSKCVAFLSFSGIRTSDAWYFCFSPCEAKCEAEEHSRDEKRQGSVIVFLVLDGPSGNTTAECTCSCN